MIQRKLVKNEISDLQNKDFNVKKKELNNDNTKIKFYSLGFVSPIILFIIYWGVYWIIKKKNLSK